MNNSKAIAKARLLLRLGGLIVIVATIATAWIVIDPIITAQEGLKQRLLAVALLRSTDATVMANLTTAKDEVQFWRDKEVQRCERSSPKNDETAFLEWANSQSQASALEVRDFRPSNRETHGDYISRSVVITAQGSYESICQFLERLRDCPYMLRITSLEILPQNQDRSTFGATFNILLFTTNSHQAISPAKQG